LDEVGQFNYFVYFCNPYVKSTKQKNRYNNEKNIPTLEHKEKKQTRIPQSHGNQKRTEGPCKPPCQRSRQIIGVRRILKKFFLSNKEARIRQDILAFFVQMQTFTYFCVGNAKA
jgi:hypothetical protein